MAYSCKILLFYRIEKTVLNNNRKLRNKSKTYIGVYELAMCYKEKAREVQVGRILATTRKPINSE